MSTRALLLAALATFRLANMVTRETGPGNMFAMLRGYAPPAMQEGIHCPLCVGFWSALAIVWASRREGLPAWMVLWLAVAGGQVLVSEAFDTMRAAQERLIP